MRGIRLALAAILLPLVNVCAQSSITVDESELRAELKNNSTVIEFPLNNKTSSEIRAGLALDWLSPGGNVVGSAERDIAVRPGQTSIEVPLPILDADVWLRLRYSLIPDRADVRSFPPISGIVAISQIAKHAFELKVSHIGEGRPGQLLTVHAQALHPVTRTAVPDVIFEATIETDGAPLRPEKKVSHPGGPVDFTFRIPRATAEISDAEATVLVRAHRGDFDVDVEDSIRLLTRPSARLHTDKPIYQPGQTIHIRAIVLDGVTHAFPNTKVTLEINDDENQRAHVAQLITSRFGIVQDDWTLPATATPGTYRITLKTEDDNLSSHAVRVSRYELPEFNVAAKPERDAFLPGEKATVKITGAYLYGKPVPNGKVKIIRLLEQRWDPKTRKFDSPVETVAEGIAASDGVFAAQLDLAADHTELKEHTSFRFDDLNYAAYYTDPSSGRTEERRFDVRITDEPIHLYITAPTWRLSDTAPIYVSANYASGKPAATSVLISFQGRSAVLKTNQYGVGKIVLPYDPERDGEIVASATDSEGRTGTWKERYYSHGRSLIEIDPGHTIHRTGEAVKLSVATSIASLSHIVVQAVAMTDLGEQPVAMQVAKLENGKAQVTFPFQTEFRRTVAFIAWNLDAEDRARESGMFTSRAVVYPDSTDLRITAAGVRDTYKPGAKALIRMHAASSGGQPIEAAFGLALVDQAVLERARTDSEFGRRPWFSCLFCGSSGESEIGGIRLNDLYGLKPGAVIPPGLDLAAELLVTGSTANLLTESSGSLQDNPPFGELRDETRKFSKLLEDYFAATSEYVSNTATLAKILGAKWTDLRDPWGLPYQAEFKIDGTSNEISVMSSGPDKKAGTPDDYGAATIRYSWFDPVRKLMEQVLNNQPDYPATEAEAKQILTNALQPGFLRDPWGGEYAFRVRTQGDQRYVTILSAGTDRTFDTSDDFSPGMFIGRYFQREHAAMVRALQTAPETPRTLEAFTAALEKAGIDWASYRDAWSRPYKAASFLSSRYTDRRDESVVRVFGQPENLRIAVTPVTQKLITFSLRSAGPDGVVNTWDDFDVATFITVLGEETGSKPPAAVARIPVPMHATGIVTGVITDPSGAVIANATVSLIDADSVPHETHTDSAGIYQFVSVPEGNYSLKVFSAGFRAYVIARIPVEANKAISLDVTLQVGSVSESVSVTAEAPLLQTSSSEVSASPLATPRIREYFPETMLWLPEIVTDKHGNAEARFTMADSITNWKLAVIASTLDGQIAEFESNIRSFQPFFLSFNPPPVLTVGDRLDLPVSVRNYTNHKQKATVRLEPNAWSSATGATSKEISISANDSANTSFNVKAETMTDSAAQRITAGAGANRDAIDKKLRVHPDGREVTQIAGDLIGAKTEVNVSIPAAAIAGATRGEIRLYPNIASMLFESAAGVLETPHGCAEQTISAGYANLVALRYARALGMSSEQLEKKALSNIQTALTDLPLFEISDGGVRYWRTDNPDVGVTAYALNFLIDAKAIVTVDDDEVDSLSNWLQKQQAADGKWYSEKTKSKLPEQSALLTGLVLRSLAAAQKSGMKIPAKVFASGYHHIALFTDQLDEPYLLAQFILAALDSGDEKLLGDATARLIALAKTERDGLYWDLRSNSPFYGWGTAGRYETTGLVISALAAWKAEHPEISGADSAIRKGLVFLLRSRDRYGSWQSTQATVRAMRAMADAAPVLRNPGGSGGSIELRVNGAVAKTISLPSSQQAADPLIVDISSFLRPGDNHLEFLSVAGTQSALMRLTSEYWIPWDQPHAPASGELSLSVQFDRLQSTVGDRVLCHVKAERVGFRGYGMMLAEVGLPPATEVDRASLEAVLHNSSLGIDRYDILPDRVLFYVWPGAGGSTFDFVVRSRTSMTAKSASSVLYDYYNPEARAEIAPVQWVVKRPDPVTPSALQ